MPVSTRRLPISASSTPSLSSSPHSVHSSPITISNKEVIVRLTALISALSVAAIAQTSGQRVELNQLVSEALLRNPEVLAAQKKLEAARQRPAQERSLP